MKAAHGWLVFFLFMLGTTMLLEHCGGAQHAEADGLYAAQLAACVDVSATKADAKACMAKVRASWAPDAGGE